MDGLDLDLYEPLSYGDDDGDDLGVGKNGRKRSTSVDIEKSPKRSLKRQRLEDENGNQEKEAEVAAPASPLPPPDVVFTDSEDEDDSALIIDEPVVVEDLPDIDLADEKRKSPVRRNLESRFGQSKDAPTTASLSGRRNEDESELYQVRYRRVLKRIPQDIPYLPVTCEDGSRLYLRLKEKVSEKDEENEALPLVCGKTKRNLIADWEKIKTEARIIKDKFHQELEKEVSKEKFPISRGGGDKTTGSDSLWVEKYKPNSFLDLLSMEAVNRGLLHWIKLWDRSVFGRDYLAKMKATREKYAKLEAMEKEKDERFKRKTYLPPNEEYDEGGRPAMKVALLAGDPGLGKTTCAHVIARHAGYKIREVNASDDRSIEVFRKVLDDTTQSRAESFQEGKPNCLVIDEIDGAPAPSVAILVEYMLGQATEKGKAKKKKFLRRPVICICNDLYAPSLKELRKHAFVIQFPQIPVHRLVDRLSEISNREELYIDSNTLQALCQKSECDIRSCLSTLQFLKRKLCTPKEALMTQVGAKDKSKGIFSIWNEIFTLPPEKRYQDAHPDPSKPDNRFKNIVHTSQCFGEYDKIFGGVFENYLKIKYRDIYLQSILEGLDWAIWFESIREYTERTQMYGMFGFLPMFFVKAHFLFARKEQIRDLSFPNSEMSLKIPKLQNTIKSQISETSPSIARFLDPFMLITDIYPAIVSIIQPQTIRPVPSQLWTQRERDTLKNVVDIMLTYNLTYSQIRHPETGAYSYILEPHLEEMVRFKDLESSGKKPFPYSMKQLISREVETEKMRRNDTMPDVLQREPTFKTPQTPKPTTSTGSGARGNPPTPESSPVASNQKSPSVIGRDFFGRPILPPSESSPEAEAKKKSSVAVYFRFKEGYSNAVRRFVKMKDL